MCNCASICSIVDVDLEDFVISPYSGPRSMHPSLSFAAYTPFCDLFVVILFLCDLQTLTIYHV
jgi:hypothetical protein